MTTITHNPNTQRFELTQNGATAYLSYQTAGDKLIFDHTIVPTAIEGQGIGSRLTRHALDWAREQDKQVIPTLSLIHI